ncbi:glycoside hydrolase family 30 beta sandwich domain-containing protein [Hymenobacter sp. M29]|uniref:Glycoside hydrolase family 30 beta sandwich domain-containing protein n=1 Tax=Hymenobacter mellowenesis TaxID=3063995 RepID=A0ABT9A6P1_9BACT|nr:glycoside hydrolase family 30 beta sandwich domain-containing protein [Hymenobacter sp. M29]MDO7845501.1 glycoside hydrolase family 30 beta sandwich domain-containing protein [Hymenobacter sp. M29]
MPRSFPTRFSYPAGLLLGLSLLLGSCKKDNPDTPPVTPPVTPPTTSGASQVAVWLTTPDKTALFYRQRTGLSFNGVANADPTIAVDTTQTFQTMDGFGYTLTGGSAYVMSQMAASNRAALIKELFATDSTSLGISYLRVSIGASDLSSQVYTYDDSGTPDPTLAQFSLAPDQAYFIPVLKEILAVNPAIKILGSPWTAPSWMKSNNSPVGGSLQPQYYAAYAQYFVKYIQGMQAQGIPIDAVTLQNEPLYGGNNPSMVMTGAEQAAFIKNNVGPAFRTAGLSTKIIAYDHNPDADGLAFVNTVLSDPAASAFTDGSAFHLYGGTIGALNGVHTSFPTKNIYFTEQWTQAPGTTSFAGDLAYHVNNLEIGAPRNWSRNVLEWNLANDQNYGPHTPGGCTQCLGAVTISGNTVTRNVAYYTVAHSSKFVRPGSVRVATNLPANLPNVAYKTPNGKRVLVVLNTSNTLQPFNIQYKGKLINTSLYGGSVATFVW